MRPYVVRHLESLGLRARMLPGVRVRPPLESVWSPVPMAVSVRRARVWGYSPTGGEPP